MCTDGSSLGVVGGGASRFPSASTPGHSTSSRTSSAAVVAASVCSARQHRSIAPRTTWPSHDPPSKLMSGLSCKAYYAATALITVVAALLRSRTSGNATIRCLQQAFTEHFDHLPSTWPSHKIRPVSSRHTSADQPADMPERCQGHQKTARKWLSSHNAGQTCLLQCCTILHAQCSFALCTPLCHVTLE